MYPVHLILSFINKPPIIALEDIILHLRSLDNYREKSSPPLLFLWDCLETVKAVGSIHLEVIPRVNLSGTSGERWEKRESHS